MASTYGPWSADEEQLLRDNCNLCVTQLRRKLNRTIRDIQKKSKELELPVQYKMLPVQRKQAIIENKIRQPEPKPAEKWLRAPAKYSNSGYLATLEKYS